MKYVDYTILAIINLLFTLLAWIVSPFLAFEVLESGYLPNCLKWFQTFDAPIDSGWQLGYYGTYLTTNIKPTGWTLYWYRLLWLCRNPAYGFSYWPLGIPYVKEDWVIKTLTTTDGTTLSEFFAVTTDGKYFSYTNSKGLKLGYKLWWALDSNWQLRDKMLETQGPDNRLSFCCTP